MNKKVKKSIIWGTSVAAIAGIAVGITLPVVNANKKVTNTNPLGSYDNTKSVISDSFGDWKGENIEKAIDSKAGVTENSRLTGVQNQLAFYLYDKEAAGAIELQKTYFMWDLYTINKNILNFIKDSLNYDGVLDGATDTVANVKLYEHASDITKATDLNTKLINTAKAHYSTNETTKKNQQDAVEAFAKSWTDKKTLLDKLTNLKIDNKSFFDSSSISSDYPKLLLPVANIRDKQSKIYYDAKQSFISSYSTVGEGNAEWQKQLGSKYGNATSDTTAIDYLVNNQLSTAAWAKYTFSVNSDFTFEQLKTNIFKDILGTVDQDKIDADGKIPAADLTAMNLKSKVNTGADSAHPQKNADKVYFFGTASKIISEINKLDDQKLDTILGNNLVRIHNAILGFKQDATSPLAPWTITKDQLIKLFTYFAKPTGGSTQAVAEWGTSVTTDWNTGLMPRLISDYSGTTDGTRYRSGNLGWTTQLSALKDYYEGFSLGVAGALDDFKTSEQFNGALNKSGFLGTLMTAIKTSFEKLYQEKRGASAHLPTVSGTDVIKANQEITDFINTKITDDEIGKYVGVAIRDAMMSVDSSRSGIPGVIRLDADTNAATDKSGVFMVNADQAGMHIIQVEIGSDNKMKEELQDASDKQDSTKINTNWAKLISDYYSQSKKLQETLELDATDTISNPIRDFLVKADNENKEHLNIPEAVAGNTAQEKVVNYIKTIIVPTINSNNKSELVSKVQDAYRKALMTWLDGKLDKGLWGAGEGTIKPEDIYKAVEIAGGM